MAGIVKDIKDLYGRSNIVSRFVIWNAGVFLGILLLSFVLNFLMKAGGIAVGDYLALPSSPIKLLTQPWGLLTYMFTHEGFFHFLFNMLWLWVGGRILLELLDKRRFIKSYWLGGLAGGALYLILFNLLPNPEGILIGASGAVYAVWLTAAAYRPDHTVHLTLIGPAKLKYIAMVFILLNLPREFLNAGGHYCHFGGALFGYFYGRTLNSGKDVAQWFDSIYTRVLSWVEPKKPKMTVVRGGQYSRDDKTYNAQKKAAQDEVDAILDKVNRSGYASLNKKEKRILEQFSKNS